jgi:ankyrin repeat protein
MINVSSFLKAVQKGNLEQVKELLGADPDLVFSRTEDGDTPLHLAILYGQRDVAKLLLSSNADVNAKGHRGWTPLYCVAVKGYRDIAELLIASKADVNVKESDGWTPLDRAVANRRKDVAELLRQHGGQSSPDAKPEPTLFGMVGNLVGGVFYFIMSGFVIWMILFCMRSCQPH